MDSPEFYTFSMGPDYDDVYDHCYLSGKFHLFQRPTGAIQPPEWIEGPGDVFGCGLLLNPQNKLAIFFTGNGTLMGEFIRVCSGKTVVFEIRIQNFAGKPIPISPSVDLLYPTVWISWASVEANFGNNLAGKPFKFDYNKCPGLDME
jgi:hypothetical protein